MSHENTPRPKLTAISQPGKYIVRVCKIRAEDISQTQKGDPKIKVLLVTKDNQKVNDTFFGSTDGALKRAAAFVSTATGLRNLGLPGRQAEQLQAFLSKAEGKLLQVEVVQEQVTFSSGETKLICKVTKFFPLPAPEPETPNF
jgi:hypothetical protein